MLSSTIHAHFPLKKELMGKSLPLVDLLSPMAMKFGSSHKDKQLGGWLGAPPQIG